MANYSTSADIVVSVNGRQAQQTLRTLDAQAKALQSQIARASQIGDTRALRKLHGDLRNINTLMNQMRGSTHSVDEVMRRLNSASPRELNKTLKELKRQLNGIQRGSDAWNRHVEKIRAVRAELNRVNDTMRVQASMGSGMAEWFKRMQGAVTAAAASVTGLALAGRKAVDTFASMDAEMANVRKFTGMSAEQVESLNEQFRKIDTRSSREDLNKLAQEAGRLGKSSQEDVLGFVRAADKINVALDDLGDGATLTLSKLTGIFGDEKRLGTEKALLSVGSVINELSQNCSASAPYLAEFASRVGGVGSQAGMTVQQIMAFGAVLDSNNQNVEASATALSQFITRIYQEPAKYAAVAGIDIERFSKLVRTDMNGALIELLENLNKAGGMKNLAPMFEDMGENGSQSIATMSALAQHIDDLKKQQLAANQAFSEAVSIDKEFEVQNSTVQTGLDKAKKHVTELTVELGEKLHPVISGVISSSGLFLRALLEIVNFIARYKTELIVCSAAIGAYSAAVNLAAIRTAVATAATKAWGTAVALYNTRLPALRLLVAGVTNAVQYFTNGLQVNYAMQQRWRNAMAAMKFTSWTGLVLAAAAAVALLAKRHIDARKAAIQQARAEYDLANLTKRVNEICGEEVAQLKRLYKAATDEAIGKQKRISAANRLLALYPAQFRNMSTEQIMLGKAKVAYDRLTSSIIANAKAKAAAEKIKELEKSNIELGLELDDNRAQYKATDNKINKARGRNNALSGKASNSASSLSGAIAMQAGGSSELYKPENVSPLLKQRKETGAKIDENKRKIAENNRAINRLAKIAGVDRELEVKVDVNVSPAGGSAAPVSGSSVGSALSDGPALSGGSVSGSVDVGVDVDTDISADEPSPYKSRKQAAKEAREAKKKDNEAKAAERKALGDKRKAERKNAKAAAEQRKQLKAELDAAAGDRDEADALNIENRAKGLVDYREYLEQRQNILEQYYQKCEEIYESYGLADRGEESKDLIKLRRKKAESDAKWVEEDAKLSLHDLQKSLENDELNLQIRFATPGDDLYNDESKLQARLFELRRSAFQRMQALYYEHTEQYREYSEKIESLELGERLRRQKEYAELIEKYKLDYFKQGAADRMKAELDMLRELYKANLLTEEQYQKAQEDVRKAAKKEIAPESAKPVKPQKDISKEQRLKDLDAIDSAVAKGVMTVEEAEKAKDNIRRFYRKKEREESEKTASAQSDGVTAVYESFMKLFEDTEVEGKNWAALLADTVSSLTAMMSASMQQVSEFIQLEADIEKNKVEKRYDREIELAEGNSYRVRKAEKAKEDAIAIIKTQTSRKQYAMQIAQAVANTATNALNAYGSAQHLPYPMSQILGALAAAMATAQGVAQIAIIKKQQKLAESQGYSEGGFTPDGERDRPVGIVHAGEWVASQKLTRNRRVRPLLEALDYAQRTNTVGSISMEDVSRMVSAPMVLAQQQKQTVKAVSQNIPQPIIVENNREYADAMRRLADRLDSPFVTVNTAAGDMGINKAQEDYSRMMRNKSPKSKK